MEGLGSAPRKALQAELEFARSNLAAPEKTARAGGGEATERAKEDARCVKEPDFIAAALGHDHICQEARMVRDARVAGESRTQSRGRPRDDSRPSGVGEADCASHAALERAGSAASHPPARFSSSGVSWPHAWVKRIAERSKCRSEAGKLRTPSNAGLWHECTLLAAGLAKGRLDASPDSGPALGGLLPAAREHASSREAR